MKITIPLDSFSIEDPNTTIPTGAVMDYFGTSAPEGWTLLDGGTIGAPASGAALANFGTKALFILLWNALSNGQAPVTPDGRGSDAESDFDAGKALALPDARGRVLAGRDNMGGQDADRLTAAITDGVVGTILGASGGHEGNILTTGDLPTPLASTAAVSQQTHSAGGTSSIQGSSANADGNITDAITATGASGQAHNNVQPTLIANKIIKL